jgi:hypothetical protein
LATLPRRLKDNGYPDGASWRTMQPRKFTRDANQRDRRWSIHVPVAGPPSDNVRLANTLENPYPESRELPERSPKTVYRVCVCMYVCACVYVGSEKFKRRQKFKLHREFSEILPIYFHSESRVGRKLKPRGEMEIKGPRVNVKLIE